MSDLTPITREEALLDGADLEPITRKEQFIKRIYDKTQEVPEPITREEWFLNKAGEGGGGVTVEQLNVTENGTYSEQGKAYSPVIVEVPEPTLITKTITENGTYNASEDNADGYSQVTVNVPYMEKKSASGDIASFSDGAGYPFLKVKANINPVQDLHGYDYPWVGGAGKNLLNIPDSAPQTVSGVTWRFENGLLYINGTCTDGFSILSNSVLYPSDTYTLSVQILGGTTSGVNNSFNGYNSNNERKWLVVFGISGISDSTTRVNDINLISVNINTNASFNNAIIGFQVERSSGMTAWTPYSNICPISGFTGVNVTVSPTTTEGSGTVYPISWQDEAGIVYGGYIDLVSGVLTVTKAGIAEYNGETLPSAWISDRDRYVAGNAPTIGAQVVYDLATPQTYQLTPQQINTLIGQNNVWNDVNGQTEVEYFIPIE